MKKEIKFAHMVEKHMRLNRLTMKELGEKVDRGESTVSMWIANKATPPMGIVQELADIFGITTDAMIYGDEYASSINISGWVGSLINPKHREENQEKIKLLDKLSSMDDQEISFMNSVADSILEKRKKTSVDDQT